MKKRMISLLLAIVMVLGMLPVATLTAFAAAEGEVYVGGVAMYDGDYLAVGATATQTTKPSGGYAYYYDGTLTLNNYSYEGKGYRYGSDSGSVFYATVYAEHDLTVELVGTNSLKQTASESEGIRVGVFDSREKLTIQGDGSLNVTSTYRGVEPDKERFAVALEDSAVVIAPLIPWSIAGAVPLATIEAPTLAIVFACFLYLLPLCRLVASFVKKPKT